MIIRQGDRPGHTRGLLGESSIAKNRKPITETEPGNLVKSTVSEIAEQLKPERFTAVKLDLETPRTVWVARLRGEISHLKGQSWGLYWR